MFRWLKTVLIYALLLVYGRAGHEQFVREVISKCRKRRHRKHVRGVTEELDEVVQLPENCFDDHEFVGFTKDGEVMSFRMARVQNTQQYTSVSLELPGIGRFSCSNSRQLKFGSGKLSLQMLEPMRRWKVSFHGTVDSHVGGDATEVCHVSVSLYWQCLADPFDHRTCLSDWEFARNVADQPLGVGLWKNLTGSRKIRYEQWGEMWGKVEIEGHKSQFVRFKSFRNRRIERCGEFSDETVISQHLIENDGGHYIATGCVQDQKDILKETFGFVTYPIGERWASDQSDMELIKTGENSIDIKYPLQVSVSDHSFSVDRSLQKTVCLRVETAAFSSIYLFRLYTVNGVPSYGIHCQDKIISVFPELIQDSGSATTDKSPTRSSLTTRLNSEHCKSTHLTGGKGANLAVVTALKHNVPRGFCITSESLLVQMKSNEDLRSAADSIETVAWKKRPEELHDACAAAVTKFTNTDLCMAVSSAIKEELQETFGPGFNTVSVAVRSSGISEDGTETSFAGQLETYLEITGLDSILKAVQKCWASSFAYQAVEYRRQNGQPVVEPMGVVIQEMVPAEVSGVLFTNDPVTGNSTVLVINAAPGLGEKVVSGKCNPDTIKVRRTKDSERFEIVSRVVGDYSQTCAPLSCDGKPQDTEKEDEPKLCLRDDQINQLCRIGVQLEETLGGPQDVEWAISKGQLYLLQARPITSLNEETDEELLHEFDSPIAYDSECWTTGNIGEMLPGVATTLTQDLFIRACDDCLRKSTCNNSGSIFPKYANKCAMTCTNRPLLCLTALMIASVDGILQDKMGVEVMVVGQVLKEHSMDIISSYKGRKISRLSALKCFLYNSFYILRKHVRWYSDWQTQLPTFTIGENASNAVDLHNAIDEKLPLFFDIWRSYIYKSGESGVAYGIMSAMLRGKATTVTAENNADVAVLLGKCSNVVSAEVPKAIRDLAAAITDSSIRDTFMQKPDDECHSCLMSAEPAVRDIYEQFLATHGHRCIKEIEFMEKSWRSDPSKLMRALKVLIKSPLPGATELDDATQDDPMDVLNAQLTWLQKYIIRRFLLDKAKAGVAAREMGKTVIIKTGDVYKMAYWKLAALMVSEGRLPDEKLMFFLTHREIEELIESRSAALVRKARRRMSIFRQQEAIRYSQNSFGRPVPLSELSEEADQASFVAKGMPVGKGVATGRACVILRVDDADNLQQGDVLICPFTDVGWSPYFPMISGLVTEMGGLISHGAVVAREVGIPCIVNVTNATRLFKTGDRVRMDGLGGVVQKLND